MEIFDSVIFKFSVVSKSASSIIVTVTICVVPDTVFAGKFTLPIADTTV